MKIESGKYYRNREGRKIGPMSLDRNTVTKYVWDAGNGGSYTASGHYCDIDEPGPFDLVEEWTDETEAQSDPGTPKTVGDMTDAEIGAIIRAKMRGQMVEIWTGELYGWEEWGGTSPFGVRQIVRIRPEPERETVTLYGAPSKHVYWVPEQYDLDTHRITFDVIDGKPDLASIRMEPLD